MTSLHSKSRLTHSLVRTGILVTSLALAGNAFAANTTHVAAKTAWRITSSTTLRPPGIAKWS